MTTPTLPTISVVIASYNHAPFVQDCLQSVLAQDLQGQAHLEVLVTDDGSSDGTAERIAAYIAASGDPRVHLHVFAQNQGACAALNDAIRRSSGQYIAVLNSDDLFLPGKLSRQLQFLTHNPHVGAVFGLPSFINEAGQPFSDASHKDHAVFHASNRPRHQWLRHFFDDGNALCHPTVLIRRQVYDTVGLYDPRLAQVPDLDQWIRTCAAFEIHVLQEPLTAFRIRDGMQNASAARPAVVVRDAWERAYVLRHYLRLSAAELFQVFPEFSQSNTPLAQQLAEHSLSLPHPFFHRFGLDTWFDSLAASGESLSDPIACSRFIAATGTFNPHHIPL